MYLHIICLIKLFSLNHEIFCLEFLPFTYIYLLFYLFYDFCVFYQKFHNLNKLCHYNYDKNKVS